MKKRIMSFLFVLVLVFSILPIYASAAGSLSNFAKTKSYKTGQFTDVSNQWFATFVKASYEFGLLDGTSAKTYSPEKNMTIGEAIKIASCMHSIYNTGSANFAKGVTPWYQPYVDYALTNGIIKSAYPDYTALATRSEMAIIFVSALPDEALTAINKVDSDAIPDVSLGYSYGPSVYKLYRAGILSGSDSLGTFYPNNYITRDAVASIVARMANASLRQNLTLTAKELSATEIASKCSPAVFYIELFGKTGKSIGSGSGFFISSNGLAVTNYHVIDSVASAKITTKDGQIFDVAGVYDFSEANDLALIQVNGSGFPYLEIGDSSAVVTGATIYAIGYPLGIDQTLTPGIVTNSSHTEDGINYIMINAEISPGSSGGALLNSTGKVIGVTSAYYSGGQNLNLAVPINLFSALSSTKSLVTLSAMFVTSVSYYASYPTVPDFGAFTKMPFYNQSFSYQYQAQYYFYSTTGVTTDLADILDQYLDLLMLDGCEYLGYVDVDGETYYALLDTSEVYQITVGIKNSQGADYFVVIVMPAE